MTTLAIIDYGSGNVRSVQRAIESAAAHAGATVTVSLTGDPESIARADRIVLPGVGHYADCAEGLAARTGVIEAMSEAVFGRGRPFLGVCVGMQLMADVGREDVETPGLGWIGGAVERLAPDDPALPIPHMGWNVLEPTTPHPLFADLGPEPHVYFVHSYAFDARECAKTSPRPRTMAERSSPPWRRTISSARNSTRKKASRPDNACWPASPSWRP